MIPSEQPKQIPAAELLDALESGSPAEKAFSYTGTAEQFFAHLKTLLPEGATLAISPDNKIGTITLKTHILTIRETGVNTFGMNPDIAKLMKLDNPNAITDTGRQTSFKATISPSNLN